MGNETRGKKIKMGNETRGKKIKRKVSSAFIFFSSIGTIEGNSSSPAA